MLTFEGTLRDLTLVEVSKALIDFRLPWIEFRRGFFKLCFECCLCT